MTTTPTKNESLPELPSVERCRVGTGSYPVYAHPEGEYVDYDDHVASMNVYGRACYEAALTREAPPASSDYAWADLPWRAATGWLRSASGSKIAEVSDSATGHTIQPREAELIAAAVNRYCEARPEAVGDASDLIASLQSMRDRVGPVLAARYGDAFDGDMDTLLDAINHLKRATPPAPQRLAQGELQVFQCPQCPTSVEYAGKSRPPCPRCDATMELDATAKPTQPPHQDRGEDFKPLFDAVFELYGTPAYKFINDTEWALWMCRKVHAIYPAFQRYRAALTEAKQQGPGEASDEDIAAWLERHDLDHAIRGTDARAAFEDAQTFHMTQAAPQVEAKQQTGEGGVGSNEYILPCDVRLPPATTICAGVKLSTLIHALDLRRDFGVTRFGSNRPIVIPSGWTIVPIEPTDRMGEIGGIWCSTPEERTAAGGKTPDAAFCTAMNTYRAMIAAAAKPSGE